LKDEFKLNGEIFRKFLDHYEKRACGLRVVNQQNIPTEESYKSMSQSRNLKEGTKFPPLVTPRGTEGNSI
jgi:hypothetical protein